MFNHGNCSFFSVFFSFFPAPFNEELGSIFDFETNSAYNYCKFKLNLLISELQARKDRVTLYFHFGDCRYHLIENQDLKSKFHVIHCSVQGDRDGLAKIIPAARECLNGSCDTNRDDVLEEFGSSLNSRVRRVFSVLSFVHGTHIVWCEAHQSFVAWKSRVYTIARQHFQESVTLKWIKAPGYSNNVKLDSSPPLKSAVDRLARSCFVKPRTWNLVALHSLFLCTSQHAYLFRRNLLCHSSFNNEELRLASQCCPISLLQFIASSTSTVNANSTGLYEWKASHSYFHFQAIPAGNIWKNTLRAPAAVE